MMHGPMNVKVIECIYTNLDTIAYYTVEYMV